MRLLIFIKGSKNISQYRAIRLLNTLSFRDQRLNAKGFNFNFNEWFVGFTDGDGCFSFYPSSRNKWEFVLKISQSTYNGRILHFIKKNQGIGSINKDTSNILQYRVRNLNHLNDIIIPLFDSYPLHTSKLNSYNIFKEALILYSNKDISKLNDLYLNRKLTLLSPILYREPSKSWIIGFIEAEGSFFIVKKDEFRYVHCFGLTLLLDSQILEYIRKILGIKSKVRLSTGFYIQETTNSRSIENISKYFNKTMVGMKSLEFRIWCRTYIKFKGNPIKLKQIQTFLRLLKIRHKLN